MKIKINQKLTILSAIVLVIYVLITMRVAIIGAGTAGLTAAKNCLHAGFDVVVYELYTIVGGTWIYTDQTGKDEYGLHIHTSMYRGLL